MLRCLTCAAVIFVLVLSLCLLPHTASARRCPPPPKTLLDLYQSSDAIYIATFDKLVDGEAVESTDDYTAIEIKKHFTVSSTLKGESQKFFVLTQKEYRYKERPVPPTDEEEESEEAEADRSGSAETEETESDEEETAEEEDVDERALKAGDTLLLFVAKGEDGGNYRLADYPGGMKKLSMQKIGIYEARINELNTIFSTKKVSAEQLIAWLIRCAEDPVTRWEGTYELLRSVQSDEWRKEYARQRAERIAKSEPVEEDAYAEEPAEAEEGEEAVDKEFDTSVFAKMLDANHKQTLANLLLNTYTGTGEPGKVEMVHGDYELIELVKRWGDPRLVGFLLDRLRAGSENHWLNASTMDTIAEVLDDPEAKKLANDYSENTYQEDDDAAEVEADEAEETAEETDAPAEPETAEPVEAAKSEADAEEIAPGKDVEPKKLTYRELRSDLLQKFIARCEKVMAGEGEELAENLPPQSN